jgi:hypothetical protein
MTLRHLAYASLIALFSSGAASATVLNLDPAVSDFDILAHAADVAAHVRVIDIVSRYEGQRIVSDATCEVLSSGFGASVGDRVTVTTLGGIKDNIGQRVYGLERPTPGEELALLLGREGYMSGGRPIVGFSLGIYRVLRAESEPLERAVVLGTDATYSGPLRERAPLTILEFLSRARSAKGGR